MAERSIESMFVGDILAEWPETDQAFNHRKMACPGCTMSPFMTVKDVCSAYGVEYTDLLDDLRKIVAGNYCSPSKAGSMVSVDRKPAQCIPDR